MQHACRASPDCHYAVGDLLTGNMAMHLATAHGRPLHACWLCAEGSVDAEAANLHLHIDHDVGVAELPLPTCAVCGQMFREDAHLDRHHAWHHFFAPAVQALGGPAIPRHAQLLLQAIAGGLEKGATAFGADAVAAGSALDGGAVASKRRPPFFDADATIASLLVHAGPVAAPAPAPTPARRQREQPKRPATRKRFAVGPAARPPAPKRQRKR